MDRSSNLKAGCKKDAIHNAFDTICHVLISVAAIVYVIFFQSCPVMVNTVRSLPLEQLSGTL